MITCDIAFCLQLCATLVRHLSSMTCDVYSRFLHCQRLGIGGVWPGACSLVRNRLCRTMRVSQVMSTLSCHNHRHAGRIWRAWLMFVYASDLNSDECTLYIFRVCYTADVNLVFEVFKCMYTYQNSISSTRIICKAVYILYFVAGVWLPGRPSVL